MARPLFDSEYLFGSHEPSGEEYMLGVGRPGWVLFSEAIGRDPNDRSSLDCRNSCQLQFALYACLLYNLAMQTGHFKPLAKDQRIAARVTAAHKALFERAAILRGLSLTDFMISAAYEAAVQVLTQSQVVLELGPTGSRLLFEHLINPRDPGELLALQEAIRLYQKRMEA